MKLLYEMYDGVYDIIRVMNYGDVIINTVYTDLRIWKLREKEGEFVIRGLDSPSAERAGVVDMERNGDGRGDWGTDRRVERGVCREPRIKVEGESVIEV